MIEEEAWRRRDPAAVEFLLKQYDFIIGASLAKTSNAARAPQERDDLKQEARLALWRAVKEFEPSRATKFESYAVPLVRGAIEEWLRQKASWARRSGTDKKNAVDRARAMLANIGVEDPTDTQLKAALEEVTGKEVRDLTAYLEAANIPTLLELDAPTGDEDSLADHVEAPDQVAIEESRSKRLSMETAISRLRPALHRHVLGAIIEDGRTVREASKLFGISPLVADGIRQKSLTRVRRYLNQPSAGSGGQKLSDIETDYRVDPATKKTLAAWAEKRGVTTKEAVRWLISDYLAEAVAPAAGG